MALQIEHDVESYLMDKVKALGGKCLKLLAAHEGGIPDRLVLLPKGRMAFVELKRPKGGRVAPLQKYQQQKLQALGYRAYVIKNKAEVRAFLEEMQKEVEE